MCACGQDMEARGKQLRAALENAQFNEKAERVEVAIAELMREVWKIAHILSTMLSSKDGNTTLAHCNLHSHYFF